MGRRGYEANARSGVAHAGDYLVHLMARKLSTLARLCTLGNLNLQFTGVYKVFSRDSESAACDLLDGACLIVARADSLVARRVFAALAGIAHSTEPIHCERNRLVRLGAYRAKAHRACDESVDDGIHAFNFVYRDCLCGLKFEQPAQSAQVARLVVYEFGVFAVF